MRRVTFASALVACILVTGSTAIAETTRRTSAAAVHHCAPVNFLRLHIADFRLHRIRAKGVRCRTARKVVRGARLHTHWHSHGFACRVTGYVPELTTFYRCTKGRHHRIRFRAG